jgi:hypothetical protein
MSKFMMAHKRKESNKNEPLYYNIEIDFSEYGKGSFLLKLQDPNSKGFNRVWFCNETIGNHVHAVRIESYNQNYWSGYYTYGTNIGPETFYQVWNAIIHSEDPWGTTEGIGSAKITPIPVYK